MKKNTMMRLASVLLVLVLLTTCAISGTFAKYVSTASGEDTARVAYWGFGMNSDIAFTDLFKTAYVNTEVNSDGANTASLDGTAKAQVADIIAPGTTNSAMFKFAYTNYETDKITAPEVAYSFDVDTTGSAIAPAIKANKNIQWKLDTGAWGTWDQLMTAIEALDGADDGATIYAPNTLPAAFEPGVEHTITWQWIFEDTTHADADADGIDDQDETDTAMGNAELLDQVKIVININATQVDTHPAP